MRIDAAGGPSIGGTPFSVKQIGVRQFRGISSASAERLYMPPAGTVETSASNFGAPPFAIGPEFLWRRFQHTRGAYADDHSLLRRIFGGSERNGSMHSKHPQLEQHSGRLASRWRCRRQLNRNTIPIPTTLGIGTMTAQGNYRAPLIPPAGGTITITAVSQVDSTQTMSVTVTDTFGNAVLQGSYAFSSSGRQTATNGFFSRAGSFVADGNGGLTGGLEDVNPRPSGITQEPITFSGSYSIGPDGRGTMQFCEPSNSNSCISPTTQFRVVVISPQQAQIIDFQGGSTANGEIVLQPDISVFNTGSVIGTYTFSFSGFSSATSEESAVGEFAADGLPDKVTGLAKITSGELDINSGGVTTSQVAITSGTYSVSSNGRGTATLVTSGLTLNLAFYMVSASRAKFLETDSSPILAGDSF